MISFKGYHFEEKEMNKFKVYSFWENKLGYIIYTHIYNKYI
jgi:hypothetical protein